MILRTEQQPEKENLIRTEYNKPGYLLHKFSLCGHYEVHSVTAMCQGSSESPKVAVPHQVGSQNLATRSLLQHFCLMSLKFEHQTQNKYALVPDDCLRKLIFH